jgi:hypothetical protein
MASNKNPASKGAGFLRGVVNHLIEFGVHAFTKVAAVALARCEKSLRFLSACSLHTPLFSAGDEHRRMIGLRLFVSHLHFLTNHPTSAILRVGGWQNKLATSQKVPEQSAGLDR